MPKQIILEPNKIPTLIGSWRVGEIISIAEALADWVSNLILQGEMTLPEQPQPPQQEQP